MWNDRNIELLGEKNAKKVSELRITIFGVGGVGSYCAEALARAGVNNLTLIDFDVVDESNINRQIQATHDVVGLKKVEMMKKRISKINPSCEVETFDEIADASKFEKMIKSDTDFVVDAIDMVSNKIDLIEYCIKNKIKIISSLGMAKKLDPTKVRITKIEKTYNDPLAKKVRQELKKRKLASKLIVAFSDELPVEKNEQKISGTDTKRALGSMIFVPAAAGLAIASEIIRQTIKE